ncbi:unnamed protein product [Calypogeia fissa]
MSTDGLEGLSSTCFFVEIGGHGNFRDEFARYGTSKEFNGSWDVQSFNGASRVSSGEMSHQIVMVVMGAIAASLLDVEIKESVDGAEARGKATLSPTG